MGHNMPPKPNPIAPVDYIGWIHRTMGSNIKGNAADLDRQSYDTSKYIEGDGRSVGYR